MAGLQPGTVVGDQRYVTIRLLCESGDAEIWVAQDNSAQTQVTLVVLPLDSPTALAVLDAANRAAGVQNPRLVRVLDVGREFDYGYFTEEYLDGARALTHLADDIGMASQEVRRLTGEVALALDAAQRRGLHHLGLTPDNVLRMPDGSVKLAGLATQAALAGQDHVGGKRALRRDAKGLVALAYAGLTGRWPLGGDVGLPPAPRTANGVARPSELAVGVPADLDTICHLTLNQNLGPISPGDYAAQVAPWDDLSTHEAAALAAPVAASTHASEAADTPGEPARDAPLRSETARDAASADESAGSMPSESSGAGVTEALPIGVPPTSWLGGTSGDARMTDPSTSGGSRPPGAFTGERTGAAGAATGAAAGGTAAAGTAGTAAAGTAAAGAAAGDAAGAAAAGTAGAAAGTAGTAGAAAAGTSATAGATAATGAALAGAVGAAGAFGRKVGGRVRSGVDALGERARAAGTRAEDAASGRRELKAAIRRVEADSEVGIDQAPQQPTLEAPAPMLPPEAGAQPSRAQSNFVLLVFAAAVVAAGLLAIAGVSRIGANTDIIAILGSDATGTPTQRATPSAPTTSSSAAGSAEPVAIVGVNGYDPEGDSLENNNLAARVYDEDAATFWQSEGYQGPNFAGLKSGVGLVVDLGQDVSPSQITLTLPNPSRLELYLSDTTDRAGANRVGTVTDERGEVSVDVTDGASGRYVIVWFTDAPLVADRRYRATLSEISVLG